MTYRDNHVAGYLRSDQMARPMFMLSVLFIALLAALIAVWIDIPRVAQIQAHTWLATDLATRAGDFQPAQPDYLATDAQRIGQTLLVALVVLWPVFWIEFLFNWLKNGQPRGYFPLRNFLCCLLPPLRLCAPCADRHGAFWLPVIHWQHSGKALSRHLQQSFSRPMLIISLLILPVLLLEYGYQGTTNIANEFRLLVHVTTAFVWWAFTIEFIIMLAATDKKTNYIKTHWIDLAIILLPLLSFLRAIPALRLAKIAKVQKLARISRIYRVRGLLTKVLRALMLLEIINRVLRITPEKKLARLKTDYHDKMSDIKELEAQINELVEEIEKERSLYAAH